MEGEDIVVDIIRVIPAIGQGTAIEGVPTGDITNG